MLAGTIPLGICGSSELPQLTRVQDSDFFIVGGCHRAVTVCNAVKRIELSETIESQ